MRTGDKEGSKSERDDVAKEEDTLGEPVGEAIHYGTPKGFPAVVGEKNEVCVCVSV